MTLASLPWTVLPEHQHLYPAKMLRLQNRRAAGFHLVPADAKRLDSWERAVRAAGSVVHYDPETDQGFFYVHPRAGVDLMFIREPDPSTGCGESQLPRDDAR